MKLWTCSAALAAHAHICSSVTCTGIQEDEHVFICVTELCCAPLCCVQSPDDAYFSKTSTVKTEHLTAASSPWDRKDLEGGWGGKVEDGEEKLQMWRQRRKSRAGGRSNNNFKATNPRNPPAPNPD